MNAASIAAVGLIAFVLAYRIYGRFLAKRVFEINENEVTPAVALSDGIDYVPTSKHVLLVITLLLLPGRHRLLVPQWPSFGGGHRHCCG